MRTAWRVFLREREGLLDHLVGAGEEGGRDFEANCARAQHVDDKLVVRRLLDREIRRLGTLEDLVDVVGRARVMRAEEGAVPDQPSAANSTSRERLL
jgi:hypothetical protein